MTRLDVLLVLPSLARGGAERVVVNHAQGLHAAMDRVRIVLTDGSSDSAADAVASLRPDLANDVPVTALGWARVRSAIPALVRTIRADPPDVVMATHTHVNLALCAVRPLLPRSVRLVLREPLHVPDEFGGRSTRWRRLAQRILYPRADLVIATSEAMQQDLRRLLRTDVTLLPNPVRVTEIRASALGQPVARTAGGRRFVSVGRLHQQKALPELVAAFAAAAGPEDELHLIGAGPARDEVLAAAAHHGVRDRVQLLGVVPRPWADVAAADVFLLGSRAEGMPNAVLEALAVGTPVIAPDDLEVLMDLRDAAPEGALRLVPRDALADAISAVPDSRGRKSGELRPSLLPERYDAATATGGLRALLVGLV